MPPEQDRPARDILICRHGETDWNRECRVMGALDVPLSEAGASQCRHLAEMLVGFAVTRIVSSPLARAAQSARIVGERLGLDVSFDSDLEEVRFGRWQGLTYEEISLDPDFAGIMADPVGRPTPGGETILDVQRRGLAALGRAPAGERTLFVSHGDLIRASLCHYLAIPLARFRGLRIDNCGLTAITDGEGRFQVRFLNLLADPERAWDAIHWTRPT